MLFSSTFLLRLRLMLVGIWLGLYWVLFSLFDHYIYYIYLKFSSSYIVASMVVLWWWGFWCIYLARYGNYI